MLLLTISAQSSPPHMGISMFGQTQAGFFSLNYFGIAKFK